MDEVDELVIRVLVASFARPVSPGEAARLAGAGRRETWAAVRRLLRAGGLRRASRGVYVARCRGSAESAASLLGGVEAAVLLELVESPGTPPVSLARRLGVSRRRVFAALRRLRSLGLVRRLGQGLYVVDCPGVSAYGRLRRAGR